MRTTKIIIAAAIAALGSTVGMAHGTPTRFVRDGVTYEYVSEMHGNRQVIVGRTLSTGEPFRLVVANGHVHGFASGAPVSFTVADTARGAPQIASR